MCPIIKASLRAFADKEFSHLKDPLLLFNAIRQRHIDHDSACEACDSEGLQRDVELLALRRLFDQAVQTAHERRLPLPRASIFVRGHAVNSHEASFRFLQTDGRYALVEEWLRAEPLQPPSATLSQACNA